jgi:branched-chain amino acid transport system substrate-binding protein
MNKFNTLIRILIVCLLSFTSCNKDTTTDEIEGREIKTGLLLPVTGSGASAGESMQAAVNIAYTDINNFLTNIGSVWRLNLTIEDTKTDTVVVRQKLTAMSEKGIQIVVGPYSSAEVRAIKNYADQMGVLVISPSSVAPSLAIADDNVFRLAPCDQYQGEAMAALLAADSMEVLIPVVRDDIWGNELLEATSEKFSQGGGSTMEAVKYDPSAQDFAPYISQLITKVSEALSWHAADKVGIYLISFSEGTTILNLASSETLLQDINWYGSSAYAEEKSLPLNLQAAGYASSHGLSCPVFGYDMLAKDKWQPLLNQIESTIGRKPEIYALAAYDALWLAALTHLAVGHYTDISTLKYAFTCQANDFFGVTGRTTLNSAGDRTYATYDFWGIGLSTDAFDWQIVARYDNSTGELVRY